MECDASLKLQSGVTLVELLAVLVLAVTVIALGTAVTVPQIARQTMRSTLHTGGTLIRSARVEAVKRNRECKFVVNLDARTMSVVDTQGTTTTTDDEVLHWAAFPSVVSVARPDAGAPISFAGSDPIYSIEFHPDGYASSGAGEMVLCSGAYYDRLTVYSAGGIRYERWNGSAWVDGS